MNGFTEMADPADFSIPIQDAKLQGAGVFFRQLLLVVGGPQGPILRVNEGIQQARDLEKLFGGIAGNLLAGGGDVEHIFIRSLPIVPIRGKFGNDAVSSLGNIPFGFVQRPLRLFDVLDHV